MTCVMTCVKQYPIALLYYVQSAELLLWDSHVVGQFCFGVGLAVELPKGGVPVQLPQGNSEATFKGHTSFHIQRAIF